MVSISPAAPGLHRRPPPPGSVKASPPSCRNEGEGLISDERLIWEVDIHLQKLFPHKKEPCPTHLVGAVDGVRVDPVHELHLALPRALRSGDVVPDVPA